MTLALGLAAGQIGRATELATKVGLSGVDLADWLECVLPDENAPMAVFKAAIDEAGTHDKAGTLAVAVCVATARQWRLLVDEWAPVVAALPNGYSARKRECSRYNDFLADLLLRRLDYATAVTVSEADYRAIMSDRFRSFHGGAYSLAAQAVVSDVGLWCRKHGHKGAAYTIEAGHRGQGQLNETMNDFLRDQREASRVLSVTFTGKGEYILHAPDLVSHELATRTAGSDSPLVAKLLRCVEYRHMSADQLALINHNASPPKKRRVRRPRL